MSRIKRAEARTGSDFFRQRARKPGKAAKRCILKAKKPPAAKTKKSKKMHGKILMGLKKKNSRIGRKTTEKQAGQGPQPGPDRTWAPHTVKQSWTQPHAASFEYSQSRLIPDSMVTFLTPLFLNIWGGGRVWIDWG